MIYAKLGVLPATIDLNAVYDGIPASERLGLVHGEVYTLDVYHAERNYVDSNFAITTTLFPACTVLQSGTPALNLSDAFDSMKFENTFFKSSLIEFEHESGNSFYLAKEGYSYASNFIYTLTQENVGRGFISTFTVSVDGKTDGFAFVVQRNGLANYPISGSPYFNFKGLKASFAVVFDLCSSRDSDCSEQEVRVHYPDTVEDRNTAKSRTKKVHQNVLRNLRNNQTFEVEVIYYGGRPNFLVSYNTKMVSHCP